MTWLALWPVERVSSWSSKLELESGGLGVRGQESVVRSWVLTQRRRVAEYAEKFWSWSVEGLMAV